MVRTVSTEASVRDTLSENPGCVVIIDDLAKSSSRTIQAHRKKLGGAMLRLAANEGDSTKKGKTGKTDHRDCTAGIAFQQRACALRKILGGHSLLCPQAGGGIRLFLV